MSKGLKKALQSNFTINFQFRICLSGLQEWSKRGFPPNLPLIARCSGGPLFCASIINFDPEPYIILQQN